MGWGTGNLGGGSGGLNFKIVQYATEVELLADTPKENTIGVITTIPITGYHFGTEKSSSAVAGMVWITTGTSSAVEFNALKKNAIQVYPTSAKQYIDGAWADVPCKSYQGGVWVDWWNGELYTPGNEYESITGGWTAINGAGETATITANGIKFELTGASARQATVYTNNKIYLSDRSTIEVTVSIESGKDFYVAVSEQNTVNYDPTFVASASTAEKGEVVVTLDVSGITGSYYVAVRGDQTNGLVTKVVMK